MSASAWTHQLNPVQPNSLVRSLQHQTDFHTPSLLELGERMAPFAACDLCPVNLAQGGGCW
jgi:hypothetical protein